MSAEDEAYTRDLAYDGKNFYSLCILGHESCEYYLEEDALINQRS